MMFRERTSCVRKMKNAVCVFVVILRQKSDIQQEKAVLQQRLFNEHGVACLVETRVLGTATFIGPPALVE